MKTIIVFGMVFWAGANVLAQSLGDFEPLFRALAELPLVAGLAWILLRQQDRHQQIIAELVGHFARRAEQRDALYWQTIEKMLSVIAEVKS